MFIEQLRIFLFSERIIEPRRQEWPFANLQTYDRFNHLLEDLALYYRNHTSCIPQLIDSNFNFEKRMEKIQALEHRLVNQETVNYQFELGLDESES